MDITVISRETIKPSSPTPHHRKHTKLSLIDQYHPASVYTSVILFYCSTPHGDNNDTNMSSRLKTSLSDVLTEFYPLAGTLAGNQTIEGSDSGLEYTEARVKPPLALNRFLTCPKADELDMLLPDNINKLSAVQVTVFDACGGLAIGVSLNHVLADASSAALFINTWAAFTRGTSSKIVSPTFNFASLFPPRDMPLFTYEQEKVARKLSTKSFIFPQLKINTLRSKLGYERPTRVEALSALVTKCLIKVTKNSVSSKLIYMTAAVNLRARTTPPLPMHSFGNMILTVQRQISPESSLEDLAVQYRESVRGVDSDYVEKLQADDGELLFQVYQQCMEIFMRSSDVLFFTIGSWCNFPFYKADFGWGAPTWAAPGFPESHYNVVFLDAKNGDGIEVWVTLDSDEMAQLETDDEFLEFACAIPQ